jgi:hypothetical protein
MEALSLAVAAAATDDDDDLQKLKNSLTKKLMQAQDKWGELSAELRERLLEALRDTPISYRDKSHADCKSGIKGRVDNSQIYLCPGANEAVLLHELVHVTGGQELDAEAVENHLYVTKKSDPTYDDFVKFIGQDKPCALKEGKDTLLVSRYVIWNPQSGEMWFQAGSRKSPKKGTSVRAKFPAPSTIRDQLKASPPGECSKEQAVKCGAPCKDFDQYGYCDRKVHQPPCYQHRSAV